MRVQELNRADFVEAEENGKIAEMPEVYYYGTRMFAVDGIPKGMGRTEVADAVRRHADPKAVARTRR